MEDSKGLATHVIVGKNEDSIFNNNLRPSSSESFLKAAKDKEAEMKKEPASKIETPAAKVEASKILSKASKK